MIWLYALPEPNQSIQLPMCVQYNSVTKTVITVPLFMIFCLRQLQLMFQGCRGAWSAIPKYIQCFYIILDRCRCNNIAGVDLSVAAGVKAARTPRHLLAVSCSCPGAFVMDSDKPKLLLCQFPTRRANGSRAERGGRAGGVSSLYLAPNLFPPCFDSMWSSRTAVPFQVSTQARVLAATAGPPADGPLKGVYRGYLVFFKRLWGY